ncbi:hypothetical protein [Nocardioides sambongensis]|uniref:hypothetical protein n=1 Tax=Nocardioides sambongensis TaxID=2589074 RepID=UPI00112EABBA|nr:hypothetical protein [Nocardioides sambongensis]
MTLAVGGIITRGSPAVVPAAAINGGVGCIESVTVYYVGELVSSTAGDVLEQVGLSVGFTTEALKWVGYAL